MKCGDGRRCDAAELARKHVSRFRRRRRLQRRGLRLRPATGVCSGRSLPAFADDFDHRRRRRKDESAMAMSTWMFPSRLLSLMLNQNDEGYHLPVGVESVVCCDDTKIRLIGARVARSSLRWRDGPVPSVRPARSSSILPLLGACLFLASVHDTSIDNYSRGQNSQALAAVCSSLKVRSSAPSVTPSNILFMAPRRSRSIM